ncbi:MAG: T9SS type A sorting domain-containing protein, partial [Candidatus Aegiribacteria sp.]|nr:T9SS type A sorting domain-containing protein [Candidatus Aegiribacteria sp.]
YGGFTWPWMMWNRWNYEAVREIWENCSAVSGNYMIEAHEEMFAAHGTDFESFFMDYGCWRWFTADNWFTGLGMYNEESSLWTPGPRVLPWHIATTLPFSGDQTTYETDQYGIHWIRLDLSSYQDEWIQMDFNGRDNFEWSLGVIMQDEGESFHFNWYECYTPSGDITVSVDANGWDYAIFFPTFLSNSPLDHTYTFDLTCLTGIEGSPSTTDLLSLNVSSNPIQTGDYVTFNLPSSGNARICVYDMSGRMATTLLDEEMQAGSHSVQFEGSDLSNGTYFIMVFANDQISGQKVVLTR